MLFSPNCITGDIFFQLSNNNILSPIKQKMTFESMWRIKNKSLMNDFENPFSLGQCNMKHHPETNNRYYKFWLEYELLSYLIFFISLYGNWVNFKKIESGFCILCFCPHILYATNLMKVWDWSFKQKYLLIKDDNLVATFANQKHNLMLGEQKDHFINQLCFSSRLTGLTSMMSFQKSSKVSVPAFCPQILVSKLLCFQNFAHAQK